ncbi:MAG: hypothetical protein VB118_05710 [Oscillospiraceae bacterium]|nr:hypothetical protein [Oscillospiraceae bacterium]
MKALTWGILSTIPIITAIDEKTIVAISGKKGDSAKIIPVPFNIAIYLDGRYTKKYVGYAINTASPR